MSFMSDASMDFQPWIDEPSNMNPSSRKSSSTWSAITVTCCSLPRGSVNRISTYSISSSLICLRSASVLMRWSLSLIGSFVFRSVSERVRTGLAGADADGVLDGADENLAVADLVGAGGVHDGLDRALDLVVIDDHVDLDLGQEVDDVFRPAIQFSVPLLAAEALDLDHREPLDAGFLQGFLHLVELEWLDDRLDLFHGKRASLTVFRPRSDHFRRRPTIG